MWRHAGVHNTVFSEVEDDHEDEYCEQLFNASVSLDKLLNAVDVPGGQGVFLHDTNAVTEAPAVVIVYLALFLKHEDWDDTEALKRFVQTYDKLAIPNMYIVNETIRRNKKFQDAQRERLRLEEERRRKGELDQIKKGELRAA